MGQRVSRTSADAASSIPSADPAWSIPSSENAVGVSSGAFGFVSLLLGTARFPGPIISCVDALVDLAAETKELSILANRNYESDVEYIPYVLKCDAKYVDNIPSMSALEKAIFFTKSIRIAAKNTDGDWILFSVVELSTLSKLNARLAELSSLQRHERQKPPHEIEKNECGICLDEEPDCVLPCGHEMCSRCEKLWVRRKLDCPFCRTQFSSPSEVTNKGWDLAKGCTEQIENDAQLLQSRVTALWEKSVSHEELVKLLEPYEEISRRVNPFGEERDGYVFL